MTETCPAITASAPWSELVHQPPYVEDVFASFVDPVYHFLYRRVGNREDAEDLTSEVFLKATRSLDRNRAEASIAQWLFTVARTVLADHWRHYYRQGAHIYLDDLRVEELTSPPASPPDHDDSVLVDGIMAQLPERYRRVLDLRFLRGYSLKETAHELGITPENVKVLQHRALAKAVAVGERQP